MICTYNRADILEVTLLNYLELRVPKNISLEVVIVDNNSNDNTKEVIQQFVKEFSKLNVSYIYDSHQGLSHARNTGYQQARGDYIAYIDDECILPSHWLELAVEYITFQQPAFLGGPYYGKFLPNVSSTWFKESFGDSYILQYDLPNGPMKNNYLSGGNFIIRRDVFDKIGLFNTSLGMSGETINYGEEQDFQKRLVTQFPKEVIYYISELFVWHCIRTEKISISYLFKEAIIRGEASAKTANLSFLDLLVTPILLVASVLRAFLSFVIKLFQSFFVKEHFFTLLYQDYKSATWRDIGGLWYKTKRLFHLV